MCGEIGKHIGLTPGKVKEAIKADFFGLDEYKVGNKWYRAVKPSEQADRDEYSGLIDYTRIWAAENCDFVFMDDAGTRPADCTLPADSLGGNSPGGP